MGCTNCYNGCVEITPDKCVKYTGVDIPSLEIETGDSLYVITGKITTFLMSALNGTGIKPIIDEEFICELISSNLPVCVECDGFTLNDILTAIIKSVCSLQTELNLLTAEVNNINSVYTVNCLTGISDNTNAHEVLQVAINKICSLSSELVALALDLSTNYVSVANINTYIENYISSQPEANLINNKMIPYVALPYFGSLINFDITGAGIGNWINVYLCNGQNGTPDLRGRAIVGTTDMGNSPMNPAVDPAVSGNPAYTISSTGGANQVTLSVNQIPSHSHIATATISPNPHKHTYLKAIPGRGYRTQADDSPLGGNVTEDTSDVNLSVSVNNSEVGGGLPHSNIQPVRASYFIMYIP